jgi:hypothetical protein
MLTLDQKLQRLEDAIALLQDADNLQQAALGDCDVAYETHNAIQNIIDDLADDMADLKARAETNVETE